MGLCMGLTAKMYGNYMHIFPLPCWKRVRVRVMQEFPLHLNPLPQGEERKYLGCFFNLQG